jgi:site-specific recombinase XerC
MSMGQPQAATTIALLPVPSYGTKPWLKNLDFFGNPKPDGIFGKDRRLAPRNVAAIVKQSAARLGFDPSTFGGHSLRADFVTSAVKRGANLIKITDVTGHKSLEMLKTYSRDAEAFVVGHAGAGLL